MSLPNIIIISKLIIYYLLWLAVYIFMMRGKLNYIPFSVFRFWLGGQDKTSGKQEELKLFFFCPLWDLHNGYINRL